MDAWCAAVQQALRLLEQRGDEFIAIVSFENLLKRTDSTMAKIAKHLGIRLHPDLSVPTFNKMPIRANSSFKAGRAAQVSSDPLDRGKDVDADDVAYIRDRAWDLYEQALSKSLGQGARAGNAKPRERPPKTKPEKSPKGRSKKAASRSKSTRAG
jgi:hypothetical protein